MRQDNNSLAHTKYILRFTSRSQHDPHRIARSFPQEQHRPGGITVHLGPRKSDSGRIPL